MIKIDYKNVWFYVSVLTVILGIVLIIAGPIMKGFADRTYNNSITVLLVFAVIVQILAQLLDLKFLKFLPIVATVLFALAFGMIAYNGAPIIADHYNNLNWQNGDYTSVVTYCVLGGLCAALSAALCFADGRGTYAEA